MRAMRRAVELAMLLVAYALLLLAMVLALTHASLSPM